MEVKTAKSSVGELLQQIRKLRGLNTNHNSIQPLNSEAKAQDWKPQTIKLKKRRHLFEQEGRITSMHWSEDERSNHFVCATRNGKISIWDGLFGVKLCELSATDPFIMTCQFSPSGKYVAAGGFDSVCSIYGVPLLDYDKSVTQTPVPASRRGSGKRFARFSLQRKASSLFHPSGLRASIGGSIPVDFKDTGKEKWLELVEHNSYVSAVRYVDESKLITGSGDATSILWDLEKRSPINKFQGHKMDVMSISVSREKSCFVSGSSDARCMLWDYRIKGNCVMSFVGHESDVNAVEFFKDGMAFASASDDSTCRFMDTRTFRQMQKYSDDATSCGVTSLSFSHSGKHLFAGYDNHSCLVWDTVYGKVSQRLQGHKDRVSCLGVHSGGHALCTGSWDSTLSIWAV